MADTSLVEEVLTVFDDPWYRTCAMRSRAAYQTGKLHNISIEPILPVSLMYDIADHFPPNDAEGWTVHSNKRVDRKFMGDITKYDNVFRSFALATSSRSFLLFLETLTGIEHLIPDPYFIGGGAMTAGAGDKLDMHVDFNWHYGLHCHRRCNALFYMTPDWKPEWGGELEFGENREVQYEPRFNRLVVFTTSENSWHGQPNPITSPPGILRRVFSAFYYSAASPAEIADPHLTKYQMETPYTAAPLNDYQKT